MMRHVYATPKLVKNTTVARVLPANTASTASPSRSRVVGEVLHFLLPLHPAVARDDDDVVFLDDEVVGGVLGLAGVASMIVRRGSTFALPYVF